MKAQKLILLLLLSFYIGSCQKNDKLPTLIATPSGFLSNNFKQIILYWGQPILSCLMAPEIQNYISQL
jgi:hypothetical protein